MIVNKITTGFVIQQYDLEQNQCLSQEFIAGDDVTYEDQNGEIIDDGYSGGDVMVEILPYQPFDMVQPKSQRMVYFIQPTLVTEDGQYIPCIAKENESGYYKTDWAWGSNLEEAEKLAAQKNASLGISEKEAMKIVLSSMRK